MRHPLVAHDAFLVGVVRLVRTACAHDVCWDGDERAWAFRVDQFIGPTQLLVFVVQPLFEELCKGLADASSALVKAFEVGGDADLHGRLHAPAYALHDERHELVVIMLTHELAQHVECPVRTPRSLEVELVVEPGRRVKLPDDR